MTLPLLPAPEFFPRDPEAIEREMVNEYEIYIGRKTQPAQLERAFIRYMAYRESLLRMQMQEAAEQNLVAYARYPMLDLLGELVGVERLPMLPARTILRFDLIAPQGMAVVIPAGTRARTPDGKVTFATVSTVQIEPGSLTVTALAEATVAGDAGNGYLAGVYVLLDPIALVTTVAAEEISGGGADVETDDHLRERIRLSPQRYSVAGSAGAYRFYAMSVSPEVIDAAVTSPAPGVVRVYLLTQSGIVSAELLAAVDAILDSETVRPLTDTVEVSAPVLVPYAIEATVRFLPHIDAAATLELVEDAANAYVAERRGGLGRDIVPSQIVAALSIAGVYDVQLALPAAAIDVDVNELGDCTDVTIINGGLAGG